MCDAKSGSLILLLSLALFPLLVFFQLMHLLFFILFYFVIIPYKPICLLMRDRKRVELNRRGGGEKLGGVEGGDIIIKIYYIQTILFQ